MSCKNEPNPKETQPIVSSIASLLLVCLYPCLFQYAGNIPEARLLDALVFFGLFLAIGAVVYLIVLGITIVVITHEMRVIQQVCTRVAVLDGGLVQEEGSVSEVFAAPKSKAARRLLLMADEEEESYAG